MSPKDHGFKNAKERESLNRIIVSLSGLEKQGKTHFSLTAPGPIAFFSVDIGEEGVIGKFMDTKRIEVYEVEHLGEDAADKAPDEWKRFINAYRFALRHGDFKTIVLDTATELWELLRLSRFGRLTQVMPHHYGPVNAEFRTLIREAYGFNKNLILLHKMKQEYIGEKKTGKWERAGFSDTGFLVQVNARAYRYSESDGGNFAIQVDDCRQNPDLCEMEFEGPMCNFQMLACNVLPDVDPANWEDKPETVKGKKK